MPPKPSPKTGGSSKNSPALSSSPPAGKTIVTVTTKKDKVRILSRCNI